MSAQPCSKGRESSNRARAYSDKLSFSGVSPKLIFILVGVFFSVAWSLMANDYTSGFTITTYSGPNQNADGSKSASWTREWYELNKNGTVTKKQTDSTFESWYDDNEEDSYWDKMKAYAAAVKEHRSVKYLVWTYDSATVPDQYISANDFDWTLLFGNSSSVYKLWKITAKGGGGGDPPPPPPPSPTTAIRNKIKELIEKAKQKMWDALDPDVKKAIEDLQAVWDPASQLEKGEIGTDPGTTLSDDQRAWVNTYVRQGFFPNVPNRLPVPSPPNPGPKPDWEAELPAELVAQAKAKLPAGAEMKRWSIYKDASGKHGVVIMYEWDSPDGRPGFEAIGANKSVNDALYAFLNSTRFLEAAADVVDIVVTPDGSGIIAILKNGTVLMSLPEGTLRQKLIPYEFNGTSKKLKSIQFKDNNPNSGFLIFQDKDTPVESFGSAQSTYLMSAIQDAVARGRNIEAIYSGSDSAWALVTDTNNYQTGDETQFHVSGTTGPSVPAGLIAALDSARSSERKIKFIASEPDGGWMVYTTADERNQVLWNSGFEGTVAETSGNNSVASLYGWSATAPINVVVPYSGYGGGPDSAKNGSQYLELTGDGTLKSTSFTLTAASLIEFGAHISHREADASKSNTASIAIVDYTTNAVVSGTAPISLTLPNVESSGWTLMQGKVTLPAGRYRLSVSLGDNINIDEPFVLKGTLPLLAPGSAIVAIDADGYSDSPGAERVINAIDGTTATKYLNFGAQNSGFIVTPSSGPSVITSFEIWSGNDWSDRDPVTYQLFGTNSRITSGDRSSGTSEAWTLISSGQMVPAVSASSRQASSGRTSFSNIKAFRSYKWLATSLRAPAPGSMQFSEIQFYGDPSPKGWLSWQLTATPNAASGMRAGATHSSAALHFYKGTDSNIWGTYWNGALWTQAQLTSNANTDDWLSFGTTYNLLCYKGKDSRLWVLYFNGSVWVPAPLGSIANVAGDVVMDDAWNLIYYRGTDSRMWVVYWDGAQWTQASLGGTANVEGSLAVDGRYHLIYYRSGGHIWCYYWSGSAWLQAPMSTTANVGGSVAADTGGGMAYYRSSADNSAWALYWNGSAWTQTQLDPLAGIGSTNSIAPLSQHAVLYLNSNGQCAAEYWSGAQWGSALLADGGGSLIGGLSVQRSTNLVFARRSDGNIVIFYYQ
jgi:hypothetical protein